MFSGILSTIRSAVAFKAFERVEMRPGESAQRCPVQVRDAIQRRIGRTAGRLRHGLEGLAHQAELARPVYSRMTRQDLLGQRGARPRHADDEDRPFRIQAVTAYALEELRGERRDQSVDERSMGIGVVAEVSRLEVVALEDVGLCEEPSGPVEITPGVDRVRQAELERPAIVGSQTGVRQQTLDRGQLGRGKLVAESGRQPGPGAGMTGVVMNGLAERRHRAIELAEILQEAGEARVGGGGRRIETDRMAEARLGLAEPAERVEDPAEAAMGRGKTGTEPDRFPAVQQGRLGLAESQEDLPEVIAGLGRTGFQAHGVLELLQRRDLVSLEPERVAEVVASGPEVRGQPDRFAEIADGGIEIAPRHEGRPEIAQDPRTIGLEPQRGLAACDDALGLPECPVGFPEVGVEGGFVRTEGHGAADQADGLVSVPALEGDQAEEVEGIGLVRILVERRFIDPGRAIQVASTVILNGLAQVDGHRSG